MTAYELAEQCNISHTSIWGYAKKLEGLACRVEGISKVVVEPQKEL